MLRASALIVASDEVLAGEFDTEAVILDLQSGVYYGLEGSGARIWQLLKAPISLATLRDTLVAEYDVEPQRCEADLRELLEDLRQRGLVRVSAGDDLA
jgi:Coenzyme PQQ synthesis protein D (PqqD)